MFKIGFHKQAVSAPLLTASDGGTALTKHELVSVIDNAMQEVSVVVTGALTKNCMRDMRDLYGLPPKPDAEPSSAESAALLLELYEEGFADADGDYTDQPATALGILEGSMSFVLYDEDMAYLLVHRCPGAASVPLFWGPDRSSGQVLLLSTEFASHLSPFPPGCAFESRMVEGVANGWSRMLNVTRQSPAARVVQSVARVNSRGALCGMIFKSQSGRDLMTAN